jgi:hypothetical protein
VVVMYMDPEEALPRVVTSPFWHWNPTRAAPNVWDPEEGTLVRTLEEGTYTGSLAAVVEVRSWPWVVMADGGGTHARFVFVDLSPSAAIVAAAAVWPVNPASILTRPAPLTVM